MTAVDGSSGGGVRRAFISYSRKDAALVSPIAATLKALGPVFIDQDIAPGARWRVELETALEVADLMFLFWCDHSAASAEVAAEYTQAIAARKAIVPLLMDRTPLAEHLQPYQYVDLTPSVRHKRTAIAARAVKAVGVAGAAASLVGVLLFLPTFPDGVTLGPEPMAAPVLPTMALVSMLIAALAVAACWAIGSRRRRREVNRAAQDIVEGLNRRKPPSEQRAP